jgi:hypothetical protein
MTWAMKAAAMADDGVAHQESTPIVVFGNCDFGRRSWTRFLLNMG